MKTITTLLTVSLFAVAPWLFTLAYKYHEGYRIKVPLLISQILNRIDFKFKFKLCRPGQKKSEWDTPPTPHRRTYNPPTFSTSIQLQSILQDVQSHILRSSSTRLIYVVVCQLLYRQLENPQDYNVPSDEIVKDILKTSWPTFSPLPEQLANGDLGVIWGHTDKTTTASEIHLNPDLIVALENAPEVSVLNLPYFCLSHSFRNLDCTHFSIPF